MSVAMVGAGIAAVGAVSSADASRHAANVQKDSAAAANALQQQEYDQTRADNAGTRARGEAAGNQLSNLLGLPTAKTQDNFDANAYLAANPDVAKDPYFATHPWEHYQQYGQNENRAFTPLAGTGSATPDFGALTRKFSTADLNADPVYNSGLQFGLNEGEKGINNRAGAGGSFLSGATLKALTRFGNDYGSTKAADSYNRFTSDQTNTYNRLAGVAGTGQQATNQVSAAGQNAANNESSNILGAGNAQAAGIVGGANALNNGISTGYNMYQGNQLMNMIRNPGASSSISSGGFSSPSEPYPGYNASIGGM